MICSCNHIIHQVFDEEKAREDLDSYLNTGIKNNSRPLFNVIQDLDVNDVSLLDIGGGIGAVVFELFEKGITQAIYFDISSPYEKVFQSEVAKRKLNDRIKSYVGDFTDFAHFIAPADLTTLDKVICCYPEYRPLVEQAVSKTNKWIAFSLPRDTWWVRVGAKIDYHWNRLKSGKAFPTYIHPIEKIETIIKSAGFEKKRQIYQREWTALLFKRAD